MSKPVEVFWIQFGPDCYQVPGFDELEQLLHSVPGRILRLVRLNSYNQRLGYYVYYSDGKDLYCGFRKSTSQYYHCFKLPSDKRNFSQHLNNLRSSTSLRYRRKQGNASKGKGSKKHGFCIYDNIDYPTVGRSIKDYKKDLKL